jgi:hypothetical protein
MGAWVSLRTLKILGVTTKNSHAVYSVHTTPKFVPDKNSVKNYMSGKIDERRYGFTASMVAETK